MEVECPDPFIDPRVLELDCLELTISTSHGIIAYGCHRAGCYVDVWYVPPPGWPGAGNLIGMGNHQQMHDHIQSMINRGYPRGTQC